MTDRFHCLTVTLESNLHEDDAQSLLDAIGMLRGVLDVRGEVADINTHTAEERARRELRQEFVSLLKSPRRP